MFVRPSPDDYRGVGRPRPTSRPRIPRLGQLYPHALPTQGGRFLIPHSSKKRSGRQDRIIPVPVARPWEIASSTQLLAYAVGRRVQIVGFFIGCCGNAHWQATSWRRVWEAMAPANMTVTNMAAPSRGHATVGGYATVGGHAAIGPRLLLGLAKGILRVRAQAFKRAQTCPRLTRDS